MTPSWCWSCSNTHALYASAPASGGGACILAGGGSGSESPMIASGSGSGQLPGVRCGQAHPVDTPSPLRAARGHVLPHRLRPSDCRLTGNTYLRCLQDAFDKCGDGSSWESTPSTEQPPGHQDWGGHVRMFETGGAGYSAGPRGGGLVLSGLQTGPPTARCSAPPPIMSFVGEAWPTWCCLSQGGAVSHAGQSQGR